MKHYCNQYFIEGPAVWWMRNCPMLDTWVNQLLERSVFQRWRTIYYLNTHVCMFFSSSIINVLVILFLIVHMSHCMFSNLSANYVNKYVKEGSVVWSWSKKSILVHPVHFKKTLTANLMRGTWSDILNVSTVTTSGCVKNFLAGVNLLFQTYVVLS